MQQLEATVLRENVVRVDGLPLVCRVASLPEVPSGARVRLAVKSIDLLERTVECAYLETLAQSEAALAGVAADSGEKA
jgi:exoribonuclease-2